MTTTISIDVNGLNGSVTYQDDAKAVQILQRYYQYLNLGPADLEPGQAMLDAVVQGVAREIGRFAVQHYIDERRTQLEAQLQQEAAAAAEFISSV